jgi:hypothetical protein
MGYFRVTITFFRKRPLIKNIFLSILLFTACVQSALAQKQMIVQKNERVLTAFWLGEPIHYKLRSGEKRTGFIRRIEDYYFIADKDSVLYMNVKSIRFNRTTFLNVAGTALVTAGVAYLLIDQFNSVVVNGDGFDVPREVWLPTAILIGTGLPLKYIKRRYQPVGRRFKVRPVDKSSPFYQWERSTNKSIVNTSSN